MAVKWILRIISMVGLALAASACHQNGTVFEVDTTVDTVDSNPGDGFCNDANGECSLRAAVMEANALPGVEEIRLVDGVQYALTIPGDGEDESASGDLDIRSGVVIAGDAVLTGTGEEQLLHLNGPGGIELDGLDLADAARGIRIDGAATGVVVKDSDVRDVPRWVSMTDGFLVIDAASFDASLVSFYGVPAIEATAGTVAAYNVSAQRPTRFVRTVDANVTVVHSTFSSPREALFEQVSGGDGEIAVGSSFIASGCYDGSFVSLGYNAAWDACPPFNDSNDLDYLNEALGSSELRDLGGPVLTFLPSIRSSLIDAAASDSCGPGVDARDVVRPFGAACDIGSFEAQPAPDCAARGIGLSFRFCDLSAVAAIGEDFREGDFLGASLFETDFSSAVLDAADFTGAAVVSTYFDDASVRDVVFDRAFSIFGSGADFTGSTLRDVTFWRVDDATVFEGATLERVRSSVWPSVLNLDGTTLRQMSVFGPEQVSLRGATVIDSTFGEVPVDLTGAIMVRGSLAGNLDGTVVEAADLSQTTVTNTNSAARVLGIPAVLPHGVILKSGLIIGPSSSIRDVDLTGVDLRAADLTGVSAQSAVLSGALLPEQLKYANFFDADLTSIDLSGVDAFGATFGRTELVAIAARDAVFQRANFFEATIVGVDFTGADLRVASFRDALMLWNTFDNTTCPSGVISNDNGGNCDGQYVWGAPLPAGAPVPEEFQSREAEFATLGGN